MIDCQNYLNGECIIASQLAEYAVRVETYENSCSECLKMENSRQKNKITCGIAVLALSKRKLLDVKRHAHLLQCGGASLSFTQGVRNRPGTALAEILNEIGVKKPAECKCDEYADAMNSWGWAGCVDKKQEIIDHLNLQKASWIDMIKIVATGYLTTESIVNEALFRSNPNHV